MRPPCTHHTRRSATGAAPQEHWPYCQSRCRKGALPRRVGACRRVTALGPELLAAGPTSRNPTRSEGLAGRILRTSRCRAAATRSSGRAAAALRRGCRINPPGREAEPVRGVLTACEKPSKQISRRETALRPAVRIYPTASGRSDTPHAQAVGPDGCPPGRSSLQARLSGKSRPARCGGGNLQ